MDKDAKQLMTYALSIAPTSRGVAKPAWNSYRTYRHIHGEDIPAWPTTVELHCAQLEAEANLAPYMPRLTKMYELSRYLPELPDLAMLRRLNSTSVADRGAGPELMLSESGRTNHFGVPIDPTISWKLTSEALVLWQELLRIANVPEGSLLCDLPSPVMHAGFRRIARSYRNP